MGSGSGIRIELRFGLGLRLGLGISLGLGSGSGLRLDLDIRLGARLGVRLKKTTWKVRESRPLARPFHWGLERINRRSSPVPDGGNQMWAVQSVCQ